MSHILTIGGSPFGCAKSAAVLEYAHRHLRRRGVCLNHIPVRNLPAQALLHAQSDHPAMMDACALIAQADGIIIATPIVKSAYSGIVKALFDLLPKTIFKDKVVLPLATGSVCGQVLALDYALKPVLSALGATHILQGLFIPDAHIQFEHGGMVDIDGRTERSLLDALDEIQQAASHVSQLLPLPEWSI